VKRCRLGPATFAFIDAWSGSDVGQEYGSWIPKYLDGRRVEQLNRPTAAAAATNHSKAAIRVAECNEYVHTLSQIKSIQLSKVSNIVGPISNSVIRVTHSHNTSSVRFEIADYLSNDSRVYPTSWHDDNSTNP